MASGFREIKRRISSIQNTKKITKAMELVSAVKMRKAVEQVLSTRDYANMAWRMLLDLSQKVDRKYHALLQSREVTKIGLIIITSNRGLCGAFNQNLLRLANEYIDSQKKENIPIEAVILGKKGRSLAHQGVNLVADFDKVDVTTSIKDVLPMARMMIDEYIKGTYDKVVIIYTDYISSLKQVPRLKQILPIVEADRYLGQVETNKQENKEPTPENYDFIYEPTPALVLDYLLPRLIEMQVYQAVLESDASEHSARMMSMRNATEAAGEMIEGLTLVYNQARQSAITAELADISGGRLALEG